MKVPTTSGQEADQADRAPRPGIPGRIGGRRVRARQQLREMRATNKPAIARLAEREAELKQRLVEQEIQIRKRAAKVEIAAQLLRGALIGGAVAVVVLARCAL